MNPLAKQAADTSDLSGGEAAGDQRGSNGTRAAKVSPEFRADPSFTYLLTDNLVEANKEILRLRDEKAALIEALEVFSTVAKLIDAKWYLGDTSDGATYRNGMGWMVNGKTRTLTIGDFRRAAEIHARLTRQQGSEEGDRLGRLKVGAGCEQSPPPSSQEGGE